MIKRIAQEKLLFLSKKFPIVTITGPRQSGKSTLVKATFKNYKYVSLENPDILEISLNDPRGFLNHYRDGVIIDEVQKNPILLSYIQGIVDDNNESGMYILTGSNQFEFMTTISQTLAGRTGIIRLLPFSYQELFQEDFIPIDRLLFSGFYPRIFDKNIPPQDFYSSYINTYVERDVRLVCNIKKLSRFRKFMILCAGQIGQVLSKESIATAIGVSSNTIEEWLTILEAGYIIYRLSPYSKNIKKRLIKSPKLYFYDVGLVSYLLNIQSENQIFYHPLRGNLFENLVINEFLKNNLNKGFKNNLYFYRDSNDREIDLIIDSAFGPIPIEIKSSETFNDKFLKSLNYFSKLSDKHKKDCLIYGNNAFYDYKKTKVASYNHIPQLYDFLTNDNNFMM